jgi:hypothetical protein
MDPADARTTIHFIKKKELEFGCNLMSCSLVKKTDWKVE